MNWIKYVYDMQTYGLYLNFSLIRGLDLIENL